MKKITTFLFFIIGVVIFSYTHVSAEVIKSFDSQIVINLDSSVSITETIVYDTEGSQKHGIFRDITPVSSQGESMEIKQVSVIDENGASHQWRRQTNDGDVRLKIGDPERVFRGQKTYVIQYMAMNAVAHLDGELDEIYWNVTGNNWPFTIEQASARVLLPSGVSVTQQSCYIGQKGSAEGACNSLGEFFSSERVLSAGEGLTVAVGFPSGTVQEYAPTILDKIIKLLKRWWPLLLPIITFIVMYLKWDKKGRDPKRHKTIVNQSTPPENITPIHMGIALRSKMKPSDMSAELIYLAIKGYIKINEVNVKGMFLSRKDYELSLLKDINEIQEAPHTILLLRTLFGEATTVSLSSTKLKEEISGLLVDVEASAIQELTAGGYYTNAPKDSHSRQYIWFGLYILFAGMGWFTEVDIFPMTTYIFIFGSGVLAFIIFVIFNHIMPARSVEGNELYNYILGLKQYIQVAEKERIAFHNDPKKGTEVFERLLPFAMILGLEKKWAKEFEHVYMENPQWYSSSTSNPLLFAHSLHAFSTFSSSAFAPMATNGSGSGGGGFSGGGGGGGGGGSW